MHKYWVGGRVNYKYNMCVCVSVLIYIELKDKVAQPIQPIKHILFKSKVV